jgi:hypothetical protein
MVKQITIIQVNDTIVEPESTPEQVEDIIKVEEDEPQPEEEPEPRQSQALSSKDDEPEDDIIKDKDEINTVEQVDGKPQKVKQELLKHMPTTEKVITQVQCQACGKSMSAKNLKYSHAAYCIKRVQEVSDKPKAIPVPKKITPKLKKTLPVKGVIQDEESDDVEAECLQGQTLTTDEIETDPMNKLKTNQITKAQKEYKSNNKQPDLPMYKATDVQRPEDIVAPTHEVRMKKAREKKQDKYDKLTSNAF